MTPRKITGSDIDSVKRDIITRALSFDVKTAASILGYSERKVLDRIKDGKLVARSDKPGSKGVVVSATSLMEYAEGIEIPVEFWQR